MSFLKDLRKDACPTCFYRGRRHRVFSHTLFLATIRLFNNKNRMKKQYIIIGTIALVILVGVAYIAGSINTDKDKIGATNTQIATSEYQNESLGVAFSYPKDYSVSEEKENLPEGNTLNMYVERSNQTGDPVGISVYKNEEKIGIEDFLLRKKSANIVLLDSLLVTGDFSGNKKSNLTVGDIQAIQYQDINDNKRTVFFQEGDLFFSVYEQSNFGANEVYDAILSSWDDLE